MRQRPPEQDGHRDGGPEPQRPACWRSTSWSGSARCRRWACTGSGGNGVTRALATACCSVDRRAISSRLAATAVLAAT